MASKPALWTGASAAAAAAIAWLLLARRRDDDDGGDATYLVEDTSFAENDGPVVFLQRHGRTSKNVLLKADKTRLKAALRDAQGKGAAVAPILAEWAAVAGEDRWFDDCLDEEGLAQAAAAGAELGRWCRRRGFAPELCVTSPFRRAAQTQDVAFKAAGFPGVPGRARLRGAFEMSFSLRGRSILSKFWRRSRNRGDAATWTFRGDGSQRRRRDLDTSWRRVAATPRQRRDFVETGRSDVAAAT